MVEKATAQNSQGRKDRQSFFGSTNHVYSFTFSLLQRSFERPRLFVPQKTFDNLLSRFPRPPFDLLERFALHSQPRTIRPEREGNGNHDRRQTAEEGTSPLHAHVLKHLSGKEREPCRDRGTEHDVGGNGRRGPVTTQSAFVRCS